MKKLVSIFIVLAIVLAMLPMAVFADNGTTLYLNPGSDWVNDGARFAAYYFEGETNGWTDCVDSDNDGIYECVIPEGYSNVIFCRMNPATTENNWDNKWNQTLDLSMGEGNLYTIENPWNESADWKATGSWATFEVGGASGYVLQETTTKSFEAAYWEDSDGVVFTASADGTITVDVSAFTSNEAPEGFVTDLFNNDTYDWGGEYYSTEPGKIEYPVSAGYIYILYVYPAAVNGGFMNWATGGSVTYEVTSDVECEITVIPEPLPGEDESNPIIFDSETYTAVVPSYGTVWYAFDDSADMWDNGIYQQQYVVSGATGFGVTNAMESVVDTDGSVTCVAYGSYMGLYVFGITNITDVEQSYSIVFSNVEGGDDEDDDDIIDDGGDTGDDDLELNSPNIEAVHMTATPDEPWTHAFEIDGPGSLHIVIGECNPGWRYKIEYPDGTTSLYYSNSAWSVGPDYTHTLTEAGVYKVMIWAYDSELFDNVEGYVSADINFTPDNAGGDVSKEEYIVSDILLGLGENILTLDESAVTTIYEFCPDETGIYVFTVNNESALVGYWGAGSFFVWDQTENKTNSIEQELNAVGQSIMVGVSGVEGEFTLNIEKKGNAGEIVETEYEDYVNVHIPNGDNLIDVTDDQIAVSIDITKPQTVVKDENGFYHLGSVNGPVIYVNLMGESFDITQAFFGGYGALTMRGEYIDADGNSTYYDFLNAMYDYANVIYWSDYENGLYPMTEDLMMFLKAYGGYQGWYKENLTPFEQIKAEHNADSAWLVSCVTIETLSDYRVVGDAEWLGSWDAANEEGRMIDLGNGMYQITYSGVAAGSYELKVTKGGTWDENWGEGGANGGNIKFDVTEGQIVVVTFNSKTGEITIANDANVETGDYSIAALVVAMMAATAGAVVLTKKKEF